MTYVIAQPCVDVKDRACVDECPVDCIYEGRRRMLHVHPDECVDCGACELVPGGGDLCEEDLPADLAAFTQLNVEFFRDFGSPGGAGRHGRLEHDARMSPSCRRRHRRRQR